MSLINETLKELQRRRGESKDTESPVSGLEPPPSLFANRHKLRFIIKSSLIIILLILCIVLLSFFWGSSKKNHSTNNGQHLTALANDTAPGEEVSSPPSAQVTLNKLNLSTQDNNQVLDILTNSPAHYEVSFDSQNNILQLLLNYTTIDPTLSLPDTSNNPAISSISAQANNGTAAITMKLQPGTEIQSLNREENSNLIRLTLVPPETSNIATTDDSNSTNNNSDNVIQTAASDGATASATAQYQQAMQMINNNQIAQAVQLLTSILNGSPYYTDARLALIKLLLMQHQQSNAQELINGGLTLDPNNSDLIELQARLYIAQGNLEQALSILQSQSPDLPSHLSYYELTAGLEQQLHNPTIAAGIYKQLLTVDPDNSLWWMGLGVALEAMNQSIDAVQAYQQAINTGNLNPNLQGFVMSRIKVLGG